MNDLKNYTYLLEQLVDTRIKCLKLTNLNSILLERVDFLEKEISSLRRDFLND